MIDTRPILVIDGQNLFIRMYCACPEMSASGEHVGAITGFLKVLQNLSDKFSPSRLIVAWEGGGSLRRRALFKEYKQNRKPIKLNRFYEDDIPDSEDNKKKQQIFLIKLLKLLPVNQIYVSDCEADDVISFVVINEFREKKKYIISSDRDFYQLITKDILIYSPYKKIIYTEQELLKEFKIHPNNFALAKAICGDASDNIPGVERVGFKTLVKRIPQFQEPEKLTINQILEFCQNTEKKVQLHTNMINQAEIIKRNIKLVDLSDPFMLSGTQVKKIQSSIELFEPSLDKMGIIRLLSSEGVKFDLNRLCYSLRGLLIND